MSGGNVGEGLVLDLRALDDGVVHVDSLAGAAVTSAGATCAALARTAALHGLRLPATPSSWRYATLGGMVANNAAGVRSFRYGSVRSWVEALTLVTADGERTVLERGKGANPVIPAVTRFQETVGPTIRAEAERIRTSWPMTRKNSCGYALDEWLRSGDLLDLVIGAEGTLGVITAIRWRLMPIPATRAGLRLAVTDDAGLSGPGPAGGFVGLRGGGARPDLPELRPRDAAAGGTGRRPAGQRHAADRVRGHRG